MSSYRSNYVQWKGSGLGSSSYSHSPASSTSSLASSGSSNKYGTTFKSPDCSRVSSREPSFVAGCGTTAASSPGASVTGTSRLGSRFSSSSKGDNLSSTISGNASSSLNPSNLSSGTKSNIGLQSSGKESSKSTQPFGLASVSALSSKFSSPKELNNFRSPTSNSSYLRSAASVSTASSENSSSNNIKPKNSVADTPNTSTTTSSSEKSGATSNYGTTGSGTGSNSYRPYSSRALTTSDLSLGPSSISSGLRSTARFGLRGTHYNSMLPNSSTLKAAAALAEESKKELHKSEKKVVPSSDKGPVTWKSRGCMTTSENNTEATKDGNYVEVSDGISADETPSFEPRVYNSRYEGVLKQRGIQTEEEPKPKNLPSAIPRPTLSLNYYSSAYGSSLGTKYGAQNPANNTNTNDVTNENPVSTATDTTTEAKSSNSNLKIKTRVATVKEKEKDGNSNNGSLNYSKGCTGSPNNKDNTTPATMTSCSDQSSRSSQQTINNKIAVESGCSANNEHDSSSPSIAATKKTTTNSTNEQKNGNNGSKDSATGVVVALANKEFRKSVLNVSGLNSKDAAEEFAKKQEEARLKKSLSEKIKTDVDNADSSSNSTSSNIDKKESGKEPADNGTSTNYSIASSVPQKRDPLRRPPADPIKTSPLNININSSPMSRITTNTNNSSEMDDLDTICNDNKVSSPIAAGLSKTKSCKNINQLRKLSTVSTASSEAESCNSSSSNGSNAADEGKKVKKASLASLAQSLDKKDQGRRGSGGTSGSSASSRSSSVERSVMSSSTMSKIAKKTSNNNNSSSINPPLPTTNKPPSGASRADSSTISIAKSKSKKLILSTDLAKNETQAQSPSSPVQTSFLTRTMGNDKPWLRKCQSGELPWWMKSNPDVAGMLGKTSSKSNISTATKANNESSNQSQMEEASSSSSSELSEAEDLEFDEGGEVNHLGERTAPDGVEVPAEVVSPKSTLQSQKSTDHSSKSEKLSRKNSSDSRKDSLFISNVANIDEILGSVSPSQFAETPSPAPTPTNLNPVEGLCEAQKRLTLNENNSDDSDAEDGPDKTEFQKDSDLEESSDDASTGTSSSFEEVDPCSVKICGADHGSISAGCSAGNSKQMPQRRKSSGAEGQPSPKSLLISKDKQKQLDDATFQLYKDGEFATYLDLESSISEQQDDFEGFSDNRKNSIVLRSVLPVRVSAIIEKLLTADGRELRRALFSLKQIFQEDKDLVHEFVENGGLNCLIKVGSEADQNYQNYILRAIGQVMLYVDGMYGVMRHNETIQWLYKLVESKFRLVQKTALKLLLVFVDYVETNCLLLVQAVTIVDHTKGLEAWSNVMNLLREQDSNSGDTELLVYAMSLVNKVLNAIPDIDTYYDQVDALEEQGLATSIQSYMGKQCADLDLLKQFQIYELVLKHEDDDEDNITIQALDDSMRNKLQNRKGYTETGGKNKDRRKSRRHSVSTPPTTPNGNAVPAFPRRLSSADVSPYSSLSSSSSLGTMNGIPNGHVKEKSNMELTPGLRRRRERAEHQKNLILEQLVNGVVGLSDAGTYGDPDSPTNSESPDFISLRRSSESRKDLNSLEYQNNLKNGGTNGTVARPWMLPIYANGSPCNEEGENGDATESSMIRENTVKDLTQKLASQKLASPEENKSFIINGELSGVVSKAKEGLAKSKSRADMKPQPSDNASSTNLANNKGIQLEVKKSDNELHWDFLVNNLQRPLEICDLDFTDLKLSDDEDILAPDPSHMNGFGHPPPAPMMNGHPPPPPPTNSGKFGGAPPPPMDRMGFGSPLFGVNLKAPTCNGELESTKADTPQKTKKTVKLFWKEVRDDPITASKVEKVGSIWNEIELPPIDTQRLQHLFESRAKDIINKKQSEKNLKEIVVLDQKRSNAINIGMTKLPPPRTIKAAIMKMDSTIINREGIEKLLTMLPTSEERAKITEAQFANPETPLGSAEQFLLTLSSISELTARLKLWAFKLDYDNLEREVAEPLMDLKISIVDLEKNKTFRYILSTLLSIGNFLNGGDAKGFQIEYLAKVPEVKDTVAKASLLHHLCETVNGNYPDSTDLYSEIGPVTRASRVDFDEITTNLAKMESDCKVSWDHLRVIAKHDGPTNLKLKLSEFLADCAERIIVLGMIHRRVINRFHKFLLWLGVAAHQVSTTKPHTLFKVISEFALEYRTTRERVIQQMQKKASHRERNKTRGKMITEQIMYKSKEDQEDEELRQVLNNTSNGINGGDGESVRGSLTWNARRQKPPTTPTTPTSTIYHNFNSGSRSSTLSSNGTLGDGDDEILDCLVKTATRSSAANRERKRNNGLRNSTDRKSLRRTLRHGLSEEERNMLAEFMANGHTFCEGQSLCS